MTNQPTDAPQAGEVIAFIKEPLTLEKQNELIECLLGCIGAIQQQNNAFTALELYEAKHMRMSNMFASQKVLKSIGVL